LNSIARKLRKSQILGSITVILLALAHVSGHNPGQAENLLHLAILADEESAAQRGFYPSPHEKILHRDLLLAVRVVADCVEIDSRFRQNIVGSLFNIYCL
jgi:hypothetical protein